MRVVIELVVFGGLGVWLGWREFVQDIKRTNQLLSEGMRMQREMDERTSVGENPGNAHSGK